MKRGDYFVWGGRRYWVQFLSTKIEPGKTYLWLRDCETRKPLDLVVDTEKVQEIEISL